MFTYNVNVYEFAGGKKRFKSRDDRGHEHSLAAPGQSFASQTQTQNSLHTVDIATMECRQMNLDVVNHPVYSPDLTTMFRLEKDGNFKAKILKTFMKSNLFLYAMSVPLVLVQRG